MAWPKGSTKQKLLFISRSCYLSGYSAEILVLTSCSRKESLPNSVFVGSADVR